MGWNEWKVDKTSLNSYTMWKTAVIGSGTDPAFECDLRHVAVTFSREDIGRAASPLMGTEIHQQCCAALSFNRARRCFLRSAATMYHARATGRSRGAAALSKNINARISAKNRCTSEMRTSIFSASHAQHVRTQRMCFSRDTCSLVWLWWYILPRLTWNARCIVAHKWWYI